MFWTVPRSAELKGNIRKLKGVIFNTCKIPLYMAAVTTTTRKGSRRRVGPVWEKKFKGPPSSIRRHWPADLSYGGQTAPWIVIGQRR